MRSASKAKVYVAGSQDAEELRLDCWLCSTADERVPCHVLVRLASDLNERAVLGARCPRCRRSVWLKFRRDLVTCAAPPSRNRNH